MRTFAPGKLVLLGEYAVLDGAPGLALAVDSGVGCTVHPSDVLRITTPDGDDRFVRAALESTLAPAGHYVFSSVRPLDLPGKPGLGGSAAAVVAALLAGGCTDHLLEHALAVHRAVQGSGSGIDVAVAATGGGVRFQDGRVEPVDVPMPLVVYSGTSAKTGPRVERYRSWSAREAFVDTTDGLVARFADDPIATIELAWHLLCGMAEQAGIPYRTPGIDAIVAAAEDVRGAAKPSGAGGGDVVVAWLPDPDAESAFRKRMTDGGFPVLDLGRAGPPTRDAAGS